VRDFHVHSNYSDGRFPFSMPSAADRAGLDAVGIADHCVVGDREAVRDARATFGFTLDETYERRRRGIDRLRDRFDVRVYDAVEVDYDPHDEDAIRAPRGRGFRLRGRQRPRTPRGPTSSRRARSRG